MKVKELINDLLEMDSEMEVILSSDGEGNKHSPLDGYSIGIYMPDSTWSGEIFDADWTADDACMDDDDWEAFKEGEPRVLVLWPVN